jgi:hypothetical protein
MEAEGVLADVQRPECEAERVALGDLLGHRHELAAARGHLGPAVRTNEPGRAHDAHVEVENVLRDVERDRVALPLEEPALPGRRDVVLAAEALGGHGTLVHRSEDAVAREVGDLDEVDQGEVRPLAGRHRHLELRVELRPHDPLLLDLDPRLPGELIVQLVHHLAVGPGETVPVGDGGLGLGPGAPREGGRRGDGAEGASQEPSTGDSGPGVAHDVVLLSRGPRGDARPGRVRCRDGMARTIDTPRGTRQGPVRSTPRRRARPGDARPGRTRSWEEVRVDSLRDPP